jgi:hypothetical protein
MFRSKRSRIGLVVALVGSSWAGASIYLWTQAQHHKWVFAESSSEPATQTDEVWHVSGTCLENHLEKETEKAKAKLKSHNENMPSEVRAWMNRPPRTRTLPPRNERPIDQLRREHEDSKVEFSEKLYFLTLQSKHIEWFAAQAGLEEDVKQRQAQLDRVRGQETAGGTLRRGTHEITTATDLLGLSIFSDEQLKVMKEACLQIIPIKMIVTRRTYHTNLWRLRIDLITAFSFGMALVIVGFLLIRRRKA